MRPSSTACCYAGLGSFAALPPDYAKALIGGTPKPTGWRKGNKTYGGAVGGNHTAAKSRIDVPPDGETSLPNCDAIGALVGNPPRQSVVAGREMSMSAYADFYADLRKACDLAGGQSRWAEAHGLSVGYVNDVLCARKDPGSKILTAAGWRRVSTLVRTQKGNS